MLDQHSANRVAGSRPNPNHRRQRSGGDVEASRSLRSILDDQNGNNYKYCVRDSIKDLNRNQQTGRVGESVENAADGQDPETRKQKGFSSPSGRSFPDPRGGERNNQLRHDNARGHKRRRRFRIALR